MSVIIPVGESIPKRNNLILPGLSKLILKLSNWDLKGKLPDHPRIIAIGAPHSAYIDAYYTLLAILALDVKINFLGAVWMFDKLPIPWKSDDTEDVDNFGLKWPLGWVQNYLVKRLGGIPVYRNSKKGMISRLVDEFEKKEEFFLMLAPEGGMVPREKFKTGFYILAEKLDAIILPILMDYGNRCFNYLKPFQPTGNMEKDIQYLRSLFHGVVGKKHTFIS